MHSDARARARARQTERGGREERRSRGVQSGREEVREEGRMDRPLRQRPVNLPAENWPIALQQFMPPAG